MCVLCMLLYFHITLLSSNENSQKSFYNLEFRYVYVQGGEMLNPKNIF